MRALARQAKTYPEFALGWLDDEIASLRLSGQDAALAHAIYDAAVRRWVTLEYLLNLDVSQGFANLEPRVRAALLGGGAQILFLDRVPVHAVINHAVEWAKALVRPGAGGLVNAVLRKLAARRGEQTEIRGRWERRGDELPLGNGKALALVGTQLPDWTTDPLGALGAATSHPKVLLEYWAKTRPLEQVIRLASHSLVTPPVVLHTAGADEAERKELEALSRPHSRSSSHRVWTSDHGELGRFLSGTDRCWVQDVSSSHAVDSLAGLGLRPKLILDLCAGNGTKTRQLARVFDSARIIATDVDQDRLATLQRVFAKSEQVGVVPARSLRSPESPVMAEVWGKADLVLLDVPCSNSGVLARRPEAKYRFSAASLGTMTDMQRQIIADTVPLVAGAGEGKWKGRIVYSTCSLEAQENQAQAAWALKWHRLAAHHEHRQEPEGVPGEDSVGYQDGAYSVVLGG